jgi:hypothetical protein
MTAKVLSGLVCAVALAGCVHHPHGYFRAPDAEQPRVTLVGDYLVVNQEPIVAVRRGNAPVIISWRLPPREDLTFRPGDGIRIIGRTKDFKDGKYIPRKEPDTGQNTAFTCALGETPPERGQKDTPAGANARAFTCAVPQEITRGLYAYEINVVDKAGNLKSADPTIMF